MFVQVALTVGAPQQRLTLPQTAVTYNPYGSTLFIAREQAPTAENTADAQDAPTWLARQVFVETGQRRGDQIVILDGEIQEGDLVITSGQMKLKNGVPLIIDNSVAPTNDIAPTPREH